MAREEHVIVAVDLIRSSVFERLKHDPTNKDVTQSLQCWNVGKSVWLGAMCIPDICHKHHKQCLWRKLLSCGEIFPYDRLSCREVSPHEKCEENLSHRESSPHDKCGAECIMWRNVEKSVVWINVST